MKHTNEAAFETVIETHLLGNGYVSVDGNDFDRESAIFPNLVLDFIHETEIAGQGPLILDALRELGSNILEVQEIRGGLNFTQVADRTVLWAEDLR